MEIPGQVLRVSEVARRIIAIKEMRSGVAESQEMIDALESLLAYCHQLDSRLEAVERAIEEQQPGEFPPKG